MNFAFTVAASLAPSKALMPWRPPGTMSLSVEKGTELPRGWKTSMSVPVPLHPPGKGGAKRGMGELAEMGSEKRTWKACM